MNIDNIEKLEALLAAYELRNGVVSIDDKNSTNWLHQESCARTGGCSYKCDGTCKWSCSAGSSYGR